MKSFQFKRTQRKYKTAYKINNWRAYEAGFRQRGSVTAWITEDVKKDWCHRGRRKPGGKRVYSEAEIETFWMIGIVYGLPLRQPHSSRGRLQRSSNPRRKRPQTA